MFSCTGLHRFLMYSSEPHFSTEVWFCIRLVANLYWSSVEYWKEFDWLSTRLFPEQENHNMDRINENCVSNCARMPDIDFSCPCDRLRVDWHELYSTCLSASFPYKSRHLPIQKPTDSFPFTDSFTDSFPTLLMPVPSRGICVKSQGNWRSVLRRPIVWPKSVTKSGLRDFLMSPGSL